MSKAAALFFVVHGEDEFERKAWLQNLQAKMNDPSQMNTTVLNGPETDVASVLSAVSAFPFLADKRLVIVHDFLSDLNKRSGGKAELQRLVEALPGLPDFARLVFNENKKISDKNPVLSAARAEATGYEKCFTAPDNPMQWIIQQADREHGVTIEPRAAAALASVIGKDLRVADSELAKLAAYVDYARPITDDDVATMTPYVAEANIFIMVDALGAGDGQTALHLLQKLLTEGKEPLYILSMINRQFRLLIMAQAHIDATGSPAGMESIPDIKPFLVKKLTQQLGRFQGLAQLEALYRKLAEMDDQIKTGQIKDDVALHLFIAGVTR
ncbi:MAG: DNA polymerase III subunit delta [Anaerolineales bacterium]